MLRGAVRAIALSGAMLLLLSGCDLGTEVEVVDVPDLPCAAAGAVSVGETESGTLNNSCVLGDTGFFIQFWFLDIRTAQSVQIDLTSNEFDTVLVLLDQDFNILADDDDSGGGLTNSRVRLSLNPGVHVIAVTSFDPGETGAYQLSVSS